MNVDSIQDVGGGSRGTKGSLASKGRQLVVTFNVLQVESIKDRLSDVDWENWSYEVERFHVWANSIGLLHQGHSSLDYRLRDAGKLTAYIEKLLVDLEQALRLLIQFCMNDQQPGAENASDRSDTSDESEDRNSGAAVLITEFVDINDRLYKFATQVRNPKARLYSAKAQKFRAIDPESGIDLIQLYRDIDKEHIRQIFLSLRRAPLSSSQEVLEASEMPKEPKLTSEDEILISRLATANTHRRQQFGQWREHQVTMTSETTKELDDQRTNPVSKPSTATALLNPGAIRLDDNMSSTSGMTISPSARSSIDEEIEIPDPPKVPPRAKHFICPYCFYLCSISTLKKAAWREHILRDLRPYVCTYPDCKEGDQLYDRWKDWANHEQFSHAARIWCCTYHPSLDFKNVEDFKRHWQTSHRDQLTSPDEAARSHVTISQGSGRLCPICRCESKTTDSLLQHIATHLQRIALFALPKHSSGDDEDDSQQENAGSTGQVQVDDRDSVSAAESMQWSASDQPEDSKTSLSRALTKEALGSLASEDLPEDLVRAAYIQKSIISSVSVEEEEEYIIKCICGFQDDDGNTIFCETCETWQHIECYYDSTNVPGKDDNHECVDCVPRFIDALRATERQRAKRINVGLGDKEPKKPLAKSHKREDYFQKFGGIPDDAEVDVDMKLFRPRRRTSGDSSTGVGGYSPQALSFVSSDEYINLERDEEISTRGRDMNPRRVRDPGYFNRSALSFARIPSPPAPYRSLKAPPIHQEIITHHRHIDHGLEQYLASNPETGMFQTNEEIHGERNAPKEQDVKGKRKEEKDVLQDTGLQQKESGLATLLENEEFRARMRKTLSDNVMLQQTEAQQRESERVKELYDEEFRERMRMTLWANGYSDEQIERMIAKAELTTKQDSKSEQVGQQTLDVGPLKPAYVKVHRKHIDPETLDTYELPWKWDDENPDYIIIEKWIPEHDQDILFEHTRNLRLRSEKRNFSAKVVSPKFYRDSKFSSYNGRSDRDIKAEIRALEQEKRALKLERELERYGPEEREREEGAKQTQQSRDLDAAKEEYFNTSDGEVAVVKEKEPRKKVPDPKLIKAMLDTLT